MAATVLIAARYARRASPFCKRSISWGVVICWPILSPSSARWTSFSARSIDERSFSRRAVRPTGELSIHAGESRQGRRLYREISEGPASERRALAALSRPRPARQLGAARGDGPHRRDSRHAAHPRLRGRKLLHDVQFAPGRPPFLADLHDDAVLA